MTQTIDNKSPNAPLNDAGESECELDVRLVLPQKGAAPERLDHTLLLVYTPIGPRCRGTLTPFHLFLDQTFLSGPPDCRTIAKTWGCRNKGEKQVLSKRSSVDSCLCTAHGHVLNLPCALPLPHAWPSAPAHARADDRRDRFSLRQVARPAAKLYSTQADTAELEDVQALKGA